MVVEFSADCNNDGIVDYGQILSGQLADTNGNNIPDCCEGATNCNLAAIEWTAASGGNGHWYSSRTRSTDISWAEAKAACESEGGHLATLTSPAEDAFVWQIASSPACWVVVNQPGWSGAKGPWLGLRQASGAATSQGWSWVTGEPFVWSHPSFDPNDGCSIDENALNYIGDAPSTHVWNDFAGDIPCPGWGFPRSYITEWSADCNNDGIVDYGQIRSGQLADANGNGVPDLCESTITVPTQFPTIQSAIDAVPMGVAKVINILPGSYNQSFSLNGKNIVVRGAPKGGTIIDGTGLATSVVRFTGGEPATAGIESLVIRNGTAGSIPFSGAPFRVGGGLFGIDSSAYIRNCRFQTNTADYGGGAYLVRCTTVIDDCDFLFNNARNEGGALQLYESSGPVVNSTFAANTANANGAAAASAIKAIGARTPGGVVLLSNCLIQSNTGGNGGAAIEMYANLGSGIWGTMRISNCEITYNGAQGIAGGVRVIGTFETCVIADGTTICLNAPRNISGPYLIEGNATVCDCLADLTLDNLVNGGDLGVVLASWGAVNPSGTGDANHDGTVNGADLALVLASWGACQ